MMFQLKERLTGRHFRTLKDSTSISQHFISDLFKKKSLAYTIAELEGRQLKRCLTVVDLTAFGIGAIIGAGIFVLTGVAAAEAAGPAIIVSFLIAGLACVFSAFGYAEFAARVPASGSAYAFSYITVGELMAWIIGWDLTLEYTISSAAVARGWSGYLRSILQVAGAPPPTWLYDIPISAGWGEGELSLDILAALSVLFFTIILAFGVKESIRLTGFMVVVKVGIILFVIITGSLYADSNNWSNFNPFGFAGIVRGAGMIFFSYLGFDMLVNTVQPLM